MVEFASLATSCATWSLFWQACQQRSLQLQSLLLACVFSQDDDDLAPQPSLQQLEPPSRYFARALWLALPRQELGLSSYATVQQGYFLLANTKTGRNEPCPCGSGKKHKACCLRLDQEMQTWLEQYDLDLELLQDQLTDIVLASMSDGDLLKNLPHIRDGVTLLTALDFAQERNLYSDLMPLFTAWLEQRRPLPPQLEWDELLGHTVLAAAGSGNDRLANDYAEQLWQLCLVQPTSQIRLLHLLSNLTDANCLEFAEKLSQRALAKWPDVGSFALKHARLLVAKNEKAKAKKLAKEFVETHDENQSYSPAAWNTLRWLAGAPANAVSIAAVDARLSAEAMDLAMNAAEANVEDVIDALVEASDAPAKMWSAVGANEWCFPQASAFGQMLYERMTNLDHSQDPDAEDDLARACLDDIYDFGAVERLGLWLLRRGLVATAYELLTAADDLAAAMQPDDFDEYTAKIEWGWLENRPYLSCLYLLAEAAYAVDFKSVALDTALDLLQYNPNDNQGVRSFVLHWACELERGEEALAATAHFDDDTLPGLLYGRAFCLFALGSADKAAAALKQALSVAPDVASALLNSARVCNRAEEQLYIERFGQSWRGSAPAMQWLQRHFAD